MTPTSVLAIAGTADSPESTVRVKRSRTPERMAWRNMLQRCYCTRDPSYPYYGGTGITVCQEWALSFTRFLQDVGRRPSALHSLDRYPDNTGNYEPGNVRWATSSEQMNNKRNNLSEDLRLERSRLRYATKTDPMVRTLFFVPKSLLAKLDAEAHGHGGIRTEIVNDAIRKELKRRRRS